MKDTVSICAPSRDHLKHSCLTLPELQSIATLYNKTTGRDPIPLSAFKSRGKLIKSLNERFQCGSSDCWIDDQEVMKDPHLQAAYKPLKPATWRANERQWLNTQDILKVMKQYELKFKSFSFQGVFPIDFAQTQAQARDTCIIQNMCRFDIKTLKGKTSFGMVLNLDKHDEPGSHWVALFACLDPSSPQYGICFYDSGGYKPPEMVKDFIKTVSDQVAAAAAAADKALPRFKMKYNTIQHQFKNTECGIFSMLFILKCLRHNLPYKEINQKMPRDANDDQIHKFRNYFYRSKQTKYTL